MKRAIVILLAFGCLIETRGATNRVIQSIGETKYWMPDAAKLPDASILFGSDMQREVKAFGNMKNKLKPLVKNWAAVYLNQIKDTRSRTLYVGPFAENVLPVVIYDYEGASFWEVGNVKSFEDPVALPPVLVTKIHTFDFLLAGISDANSRAAQQFLIKWQVANCVIDGMRVEVTSDDIAKAQRHSHPSMSELNLVSPWFSRIGAGLTGDLENNMDNTRTTSSLARVNRRARGLRCRGRVRPQRPGLSKVVDVVSNSNYALGTTVGSKSNGKYSAAVLSAFG